MDYVVEGQAVTVKEDGNTLTAVAGFGKSKATCSVTYSRPEDREHALNTLLTDMAQTLRGNVPATVEEAPVEAEETTIEPE